MIFQHRYERNPRFDRRWIATLHSGPAGSAQSEGVADEPNNSEPHNTHSMIMLLLCLSVRCVPTEPLLSGRAGRRWPWNPHSSGSWGL